jgi:TPR repeat protein
MVNGRGGPRDPAGAASLFESAAAKGHVGAMFALAALKSGGYGVTANHAISVHWLRMAAEHGHGEAQAMLGRSLMSDPEHAVAAFQSIGRQRCIRS